MRDPLIIALTFGSLHRGCLLPSPQHFTSEISACFLTEPTLLDARSLEKNNSLIAVL